jgi:hypothetical protein
MSVLTITPLLILLAAAQPKPFTAKPTEDSAAVSIDEVRIVLEREGAYMRVQQSFRFSTGKGQLFLRDKGYAVPLPQGAWAPRIMGDEEMAFQMLEDRVLVKEPISSKGLMMTISFNLPIKNSTMVLKQQLGKPVAQAQAYSNWTDGTTRLMGQGFPPAQQRELNNGLLALFLFGRNIEDGHLVITLAGLADSVQRPRAMWTMGLSIAVLLMGLFLWLRRRGRSTDTRAT